MLSKKATFGAGCYWGTEQFFKRDFGKAIFPGTGTITSGRVGFMGPPTAKKDPLYAEVRTGTTDHVEVFDLEFDGDEVTYENLVKHFFMFHDPTTWGRQGEDVGSQYASVIYCHDEKQIEIATKVKNELQELINSGVVTCFETPEVTTLIVNATAFYSAHDEHQEYLDKNPDGWCIHAYRFREWPSKQ